MSTHGAPAYPASSIGLWGTALTSFWVAAYRAVDSEHDQGLFRDPFAPPESL